MSDYSALRKLAEAATPGPWAHDEHGHVMTADGLVCDFFGARHAEDGRYIAALDPQTVLALLDALDARAVAVREVPYAGMTFVDDEAGSADSLDAAVVKAAKHLLDTLVRVDVEGFDDTCPPSLFRAADALRDALRAAESVRHEPTAERGTEP